MIQRPLVRFKSISVFHQGALGDFLLACPVFEALSNLVDSKRILFWTRSLHAELIKDEPFFGGFFSHDDPSILPFFDDLLWKDAEIPPPCLNSDLVIFFGKKTLRAVSYRLGQRVLEYGSKCLWCPSFPEEGLGKPVPLFIAENLSQRLLIDITLKPFRLNIPPRKLEEARLFLGDLKSPIFIHPGSGGLRKIWPLSRWMGLIDWIKHSFPHLPIVVITGPSDEIIEPLVRWAFDRYKIARFHSLSLPLLSALLSLGALYIGNDSGISHLAVASGVPSVVIFGPTDPSTWAPWGNQVKVLKQTWKEEEILLMPKNSDKLYLPDRYIQDAVFRMVRKDLL
ncbi:MAG: hypothetical protein N2260_00165 [Syntrophobacterales bacterium]|nr:hypothetical protein [Syntrophobacterales bacterium]